MKELLSIRPEGIYCAQADVFIDPWKPVKRALITHGHSDHARWGHASYVCTHAALPVIRYRLGDQISISGMDYGEELRINGVAFSFHPAGHIPGSAQIRVSYQGEVWCVSGDYKTEDDGVAEPFEAVRCHGFVTESTFGLPVYRWKPQSAVFDQINLWWENNKKAGKVSILTAYALGKAQRILQGLDDYIGPIYTHGAIENTNEVLREQGLTLKETVRVRSDMKKGSFKDGLVLAPPSAIGSPWIRKFQPYDVAIASGWMQLRGTRRRRAVGRGFVLSDHADWEGLNSAIASTGAEKIWVTHGYTGVFSQWLKTQGYDARVLETSFTGEGEDSPESEKSLEE